MGCSDRLVILDAQKGDIISDWPSAYTDELKCVDWRGDTILTCGTLSTDNVIRLWRIGQTQYVKQFTPSLAVDGVGSCHFDNSTKKMISTICSNILVRFCFLVVIVMLLCYCVVWYWVVFCCCVVLCYVVLCGINF